MSSPAIRLVQEALRDLLVAALPDHNVFIDRSDGEPLGDHERPGCVIRVFDTQFEISPEQGGGQTMHRAMFQLDFHSDSYDVETIDAANQRAIATTIGAFGSDRTLGNRLQSIEEQSVSGSETEGATIGCAILTVEVIFYTPRGNFFTIVGVGGQLFT
jgi:hypothetical protein